MHLVIEAQKAVKTNNLQGGRRKPGNCEIFVQLSVERIHQKNVFYILTPGFNNKVPTNFLMFLIVNE